jgi:hypothetical protein
MNSFETEDRSTGRLPRHEDPIESEHRTHRAGAWGEISVPLPAPVKASVARLKAIETKIRTYTQNHGH